MAALLDKLLGRGAEPAPTEEIPPNVQKRLKRGRDDMKRDAPKRRLCARFERGDTYWFLDGQGKLNFQATTPGTSRRSGKPAHRVRNKYNFIRPIITAKVSASSQRIPGFEVVPTSTDPQKWGGARLAERVAVAGYDTWRLHDVDVRASYLAIGAGGEAFAVPYFDPNVGPYHAVPDEQTGEERMVGEGEVKVFVVGGNECYWEPGCSFMDSRWHAIERAVPVEFIEEMPGFFGDPIAPDASTSDIPTDTHPEHMAMLTEYFERPCREYPEGRHLAIAGSRQVVPERQYPLRTRAGDVVDEPVPHRLAWDLDDGSQRDFGLTWQLIDPQRTAQDARNKAIEWKNRALNPQWWARVNSLISPRTDEPGVTNYYQGDQKPEQEQVQPIPDSLFRIADVAKADMHEIGFDTSIQADPNVAARTVNAVVEQTNLQWAAFLIGKADWWSRLMRHCLLYVSCHYTEPRLLKFRGRDGWETIADFEGIQLVDEIDVRVNASSLPTLTRAQVRDMLNWIATTFPGWLNPQDALAALESGNLDRLMTSYWLDVARANTVVQKIRDGSVMSMPPRGTVDPITKQPIIDPMTSEPMPYPGYMPDEQDNLQIWERVFSDWMKTDDYASQAPEAQEVARQIWDGIQTLKTAQAQREAAQQTAMAEQLGMANATKPAQPKVLPSQPAGGE